MPVIDYQICLAKPTAQEEEWVSVSALGGSGTRRETLSAGMDYASFQINSRTALTDAPAFAYHAVVRLRRVVDGVPSYWFVGRVASNVPRRATGSGESYVMRIEGPWSWFEGCTFRQPWAAAGGGKTKPRVILYCDAAGARVTTGAQVIAAVEFARAAGCPIAQTTSATVAAGFSPPFDERINIKVADVIANALSYHPHATCWFDYSQRDPVFHLATRSDLPAVSLSVEGRDDVEITPRYDMQAPACAICYEKSNSVDGEQQIETTLDYAPVIANETEQDRDARLAQADVIWACYDLQGASVTTVSQVIDVEQFPVDLNSVAWWQARCPSLADYDAENLEITNAERLGDSNLANILIRGEVQDWMSTVSSAKERVRCDCYFAKYELIDGVSVLVHEGTKSLLIELTVTGASAGEHLYRAPVSIDAGEPVPTGVAAQLYSEWSQLHYQGKIVVPAADLIGTATPGHKLNLTDGIEEWETMGALIIRCSEDADRGVTEIEFGVADWLEVDARVAFARATRLRTPATSRVWRTGPSTVGVSGPVSAVIEREGVADKAFIRQLYTATGTPRHMILLDAEAITKTYDASTASLMQPREMWLPFVDANDGYKIKAKLAQVLASAQYGDVAAINLPLAAEDPGTAKVEIGGASGSMVEGSATQATDTWVAGGANGLDFYQVTRLVYDHSAATPMLLAFFRVQRFDKYGRLRAVTGEGVYTVETPIT